VLYEHTENVPRNQRAKTSPALFVTEVYNSQMVLQPTDPYQLPLSKTSRTLQTIFGPKVIINSE